MSDRPGAPTDGRPDRRVLRARGARRPDGSGARGAGARHSGDARPAARALGGLSPSGADTPEVRRSVPALRASGTRRGRNPGVPSAAARGCPCPARPAVRRRCGPVPAGCPGPRPTPGPRVPARPGRSACGSRATGRPSGRTRAAPPPGTPTDPATRHDRPELRPAPAPRPRRPGEPALRHSGSAPHPQSRPYRPATRPSRPERPPPRRPGTPAARHTHSRGPTDTRPGRPERPRRGATPTTNFTGTVRTVVGRSPGPPRLSPTPFTGRTRSSGPPGGPPGTT